MKLTDKVAIVTGAAQGLGRAIVERFVEAQVQGVVAADVNEDVLETATKQIRSGKDGQILPVTTDVSDPAQIQRMVEAALKKFSRIDILVNNASVCPVIDWEDVTVENWNQILAVNLTGMLLCTKAVVPHMQSQGDGRIVYVSSPAARVGSIIAHVGYGATKAGALALMKSVAKRFAQDGIRANAILPGPIDTPLSRSFGEKYWESQQERPLLKRHAAASEVADSVLFLVSDRSSYITGHELWVDGGWSLG